MHEHARRDNDLATFTNQLLAGKEPEDMTELEDLTPVVRQLHAVIAPDEEPTSAFRAQLSQRLEMEWRLQHQRPARWWASRRVRRFSTLAAALLMLAAATIWLSWHHDGEGGALSGTAIGPTASALVAFGAVVLGGLVLLALYRRKR